MIRVLGTNVNACYNSTMISQLQKFIETTKPNLIGPRLASKAYRPLYDWVMSQTTNLAENSSLSARVYAILNGPPPVCVNGNTKKFRNFNDGYGFCGSAKDCQCHKESFNNTRHLISDETKALAAEKRKRTNQERYGIDNPLKDDTNKQRRLSALQSSTKVEVANKEKLKVGYDEIVTRTRDVATLLTTVDEYIGCSRKNRYQWQCCECATEFTDHVDCGRVPRCPECNPINLSDGHKEICKILDECGISYSVNDRSVVDGFELDIWVPSIKLGIEFNGVYWHSDKFKLPTYHSEKWVACNQLGIKLVQIFSDEWENKRELIVARVKSFVGCGKKYDARKLELRAVPAFEADEFLVGTHIQGKAASSVRYGLYNSGELVALMTFGKSRYRSDHDWELIRFCSIGNVRGGASRLFKAFTVNHSPKSVVSYSNRNWGNGSLYTNLGFTDITADPLNFGYYWVKGNHRLNRKSTMKKTLVSEGYDSSKTEDQIMKERGFLKIYDAGNSVFSWVPPVNQSVNDDNN